MQQISIFLFIVVIMLTTCTNAFTLHIGNDHINDGYSIGNVRCDVCDLSVIAIEDYLESNHTIIELKQLLNTVCSKTPLSTMCTNLVNSYLPQIITYLEKKENPQTVCNQLGFCSIMPSIHYKYDFCNSLLRLYTNIHQNKMSYFSNDCTSYNCTKTSFVISKYVYSYLYNFVMTYHVCNGILLPL